MLKAKPDAETKKPAPISISIDATLLGRVDGEMWTRKIRNRSEMIRLLVTEGLFRAERLRAKGKSVEV